MATEFPLVDQNRIKVNQALTILLLILGFVLNSPIPVAIAGISLLWGVLGLPFAPYGLIYNNLLQPAGIVKPNPQPDQEAPHKFAALLGGSMDMIALVFFALNLPVVAWVLVAIHVVLANLNLWLNFCVGCWMYYQLNRLGIPGFTVAPIRES